MPSQTVEQQYGFENPFKPDPLVKKTIRFLPRGRRLLDVGCGEGADSAFFARKGFTVTAIDGSKMYIQRFRRYCKDKKLAGISVLHRDIVRYRFPRNHYDVIVAVLVICCMKRSNVERMVNSLKHSVKPGGIIVMSSRNYLDPEMEDCIHTERMIEPNTFRTKEDCCKFLYFIEKNRLRDIFSDCQILFYREGFAPCKYGEHAKHGDSYIICRRKR